MKLLLNVLKTLSILGLHAEKEKKKNSERYLKIFYSLVNLQSEEKTKLKQRSIGQMNPYFFNTEFVSSFSQ